jgi:hypothetical protein
MTLRERHLRQDSMLADQVVLSGSKESAVPEACKSSAATEQKPSNRGRGAAFVLCRPGMIVGLVAEMINLSGSIWMVVVEGHIGYLWFCAGYSMVGGLGILKIWYRRKHRSQPAVPPARRREISHDA